MENTNPSKRLVLNIILAIMIVAAASYALFGGDESGSQLGADTEATTTVSGPFMSATSTEGIASSSLPVVGVVPLKSYSPAPEAWKTFSKYGLNIDYPSHAQISEVEVGTQKSILFTTSDGMAILVIADKKTDSKGVAVPLDCDDAAPNIRRESVIINKIDFLSFDVSAEMSKSSANANKASATEYCVMRNKIAYKLITLVEYNPKFTKGLNLEKNPMLDRMAASFKLDPSITNPVTITK